VLRLLALLVALTLTLCAPASASASAAPAAPGLETIVQDDRLLLHRPADEVRAHMAQLAALGVDRVRLTAVWSTLTRDADGEARPAFDARDPAAYEQARWAGLDRAVRLAGEAGLGVVMDVGFFGPRWATEGDPPGPRARTNVDPAAFADFTVAVARRYSGAFAPPLTAAAEPEPEPSQDDAFLAGVFGEPPEQDSEPPPARSPDEAGRALPAVDRFILWNEPNHPGLFGPQWREGRPVSPALYATMVRAAYPAAKAARPDAAFLVGNTSSIGGSMMSGVAPLRFVRELACVDARLRPLRTPECGEDFAALPGDGFAHHPYARNEPPDRRIGQADDVAIADVPKLAALLRALVDRGRLAPGLADLHLTEFGYETGLIEGRRAVTEAEQAAWLVWAEAIATRTRGVRSVAQFLLRDQPPAAERVSDSPRRGFGQYFSGLLTAEGRPKQAAAAFVAGLFVQRAGTRSVRVFGRLRLGRADAPQRVVVVERQAGPASAPWRKVARVRAGARDAFDVRARWVRGARWRLRTGDVVSAPVTAAPPSPPAARSALRRAELRGLRVTVRTADPGRLTAVVRRGRRVLARGAREVLKSDRMGLTLRRTAAGRRARRGRATLVLTYAHPDGRVDRHTRRIRLRR